MRKEEGIITAVFVTSGEVSNEPQLASHVEISHQANAEFDYIVGDAAYSSRDNLIYAASQGCKLVAPLNPPSLLADIEPRGRVHL